MLIAFELSGEHSTLPESEVIACLESLAADFGIYLSLDGCLIVDLRDNVDHIIEVLSKRLSMTHHIIEVLGISGISDMEIMDAVDRTRPRVKETYSIRVRRIKGCSTIDTGSLERRIGGIFFKVGAKADLKNPRIQFRLILTEDKAIFGMLSGSIDRSAFEARKPHYKPFFYPGVLMPRVALALVNIAKPERSLFDPFCGTGGILVEAGLIGLFVMGGEMQRKLLLGAKMNLDHYKLNYSLMFEDACRMAIRDDSIDAVVTDPPYGRSAAIKAESIEHLLAGSLKEIYRVLKPNKRAVFISDREIYRHAEKAGFKLIELHLQRVHKSLTRRIYVLEKN